MRLSVPRAAAFRSSRARVGARVVATLAQRQDARHLLLGHLLVDVEDGVRLLLLHHVLVDADDPSPAAPRLLEPEHRLLDFGWGKPRSIAPIIPPI